MDSIDHIPSTLSHINAQFIDAHFSDILSIITDNKPHILAISESWLKPSTAPSRFQVPDNELFRANRVGKRAKGVALFAHRSLSCRVIALSP